MTDTVLGVFFFCTHNLEMSVKARGGGKRPLVPGFPGFPVTLIFMFFWISKQYGYVNTLRLELRLVRGLGLGYTRVRIAPSADAVSLF